MRCAAPTNTSPPSADRALTCSTGPVTVVTSTAVDTTEPSPDTVDRAYSTVSSGPT
jgi:hypothetical protein